MIISDNQGDAIICWSNYMLNHRGLYIQKINRDGTALWDPNGIMILAYPQTAYKHTLINDDDGGAFIAWQHDYSYNIYAQRLDSSGSINWEPNGVKICAAENHQIEPMLVSDGAGGIIVSWQDQRLGSDESTNIYAQRVNGDGAVQWATNGVPVTQTPGLYQNQVMVPDRNGGAVIAWETEVPYILNDFIYSFDDNSQGWNFIDDPDDPFATNGEWSDSAGVTGNDGGLSMTLGDGVNEYIQLSCLYQTDVVLEAAVALNIDFSYAVDYGAGLIPAIDRWGMFVRVFYLEDVDDDGDEEKIYILVRHVANNQNNSRQYAPTGNPVITDTLEPDRTYTIQIIATLSHTSPWPESQLKVYLDQVEIIPTFGHIVRYVYAQIISRDGATLYPGSGIPVHTANIPSWNYAHPTMATDSQGGAIVSWIPDRSYSNRPSLYTQRILANGDLPETNHQLINSTGSHIFTDTAVAMNFNSLVGSGNVDVMELENIISPDFSDHTTDIHWSIRQADELTAFNADVTFDYTGHLGPLSESDLKLFRNNGSGWSLWTDVSLNQTTDTITAHNVNSFSYWTLADSESAFGSVYIADFDKDGDVDFVDLFLLHDHWLTSDPIYDIAPPGGDGRVNFTDFVRFTDLWLKGTFFIH